MSFNATLIGQMITFALFVIFTMKYVWPPLLQAMEDRQKRIAEGLASAERGVHEQQLAQEHATALLKQAKQQASEIVKNAQKRANDIVEQSKHDAQTEGQKQLAAAQSEIDHQIYKAREVLRQQVADLALEGASRILQKEIDANTHKKVLDDLVAQL